MKAISIRQPWVDAVLYGGKRVENRGPRWGRCKHRGPLLLHAAKGMTDDEYHEACEFMREQGIAWRPDRNNLRQFVRGAIVGVTEVIDIVTPGGQRVDFPTLNVRDDEWYTGGFGLVFGPTHAFDAPIPYKGNLSLFNVPDELVAEAIRKIHPHGQRSFMHGDGGL